MNTKRSPHIGDFSGALIDYNGVGPWSVDGIRDRYQKIASTLGVPAQQLVPNRRQEGKRSWVFPLMDKIVEMIDLGDGAAIEIGIEFLEEDDFFAFGRLIKSNTARALRRATLNETQKERLRQRIVSMMLAGNVPHEFREYKRLLRAIGVEQFWPALDNGVDRNNRYVMRYYDYLNQFAREKPEA